MKSHEVLRRAFKKQGAKQIAAKLKLSQSMVHKWSRRRPDGRSEELNPLDRMVQLRAATGDVRLLQWLCAEAGGFFVLNPPAKRLRKEELPRHSCRVMRELAHLQAALAERLEDCRAACAQTPVLREHWEVLKSDMERFVQMCEGTL